MPLIKPRTTRTTLVRHITQLFAENQEELYAYAKFINESTAYVLNELIDTVLKKDTDYKKWREEHQQSFLPSAGPSTPRSRPSSRARTSAGRAGIQALPPPA
jgi:hypothetical protein